MRHHVATSMGTAWGWAEESKLLLKVSFFQHKNISSIQGGNLALFSIANKEGETSQKWIMFQRGEIELCIEEVRNQKVFFFC